MRAKLVLIEKIFTNESLKSANLCHVDFSKVKCATNVSLPMSTIEQGKHAKHFDEHQFRMIAKLNGDTCRHGNKHRRNAVTTKREKMAFKKTL